MLSLFGAGIGRGIAIGKAYVLKNSDIEIQRIEIDQKEVPKEIRRFKKAIIATENQYKTVLGKLPKDAPKENSAFIKAHMMMLNDPLLGEESIKIIRRDRVNAEYAVEEQANNLIQVFDNMQDTYLRNKKNDVRQITNRLLRNLMGIISHTLDEYEGEELDGRIIVGKDLSPAETLYLRERKVVAFVTDLGSQISHTAIVARSLKLPAVVGLHGSSRYIAEDDLLIVDGMRGIIIVNPGTKVLKQYKALQRQIKELERKLATLTRKASKTLNGDRIQLLANIETAEELREVGRANAAGIGLYRTEYLYMNRSQAPSEEEQFKAYKRIVTRLNKKPVVIRTLDVGGDKQLEFNYPQKKSSESPLGLRAVRLCLQDVELFKPQLRAILRASAFGRVSILVPMITNTDEVIQVKNIIKQTKAELKAEKIAYDARIKVGGMIEVPAAAISAELFAHHFDFLSIGTNDLIQYTLAIDRVDDAVNYLYDPLHPAVLGLIAKVIQAGEKANIPVSLCGEMAGNVDYTRLLLGLGLRSFSMDATYLLAVKEKVINADISKFNRSIKLILNAESTNEAREFLKKLNQL